MDSIRCLVSCCKQVPGNREEFAAYGLLFAQTAGQRCMLAAELPVVDLDHPFVVHAMAVSR